MTGRSVRDPLVQAAIGFRMQRKSERKARAAVLEALADGAIHGLRELAEQTEFSWGEICRAVDQLRVAGQVVLGEDERSVVLVPAKAAGCPTAESLAVEAVGCTAPAGG